MFHYGMCQFKFSKKAFLKVIHYQKAFTIWSNFIKKIVTIIGNKTYKTF